MSFGNFQSLDKVYTNSPVSLENQFSPLQPLVFNQIYSSTARNLAKANPLQVPVYSFQPEPEFTAPGYVKVMLRK